MGEKDNVDERENERYSSAIPFLPPIGLDTLKYYYWVYGFGVAGLVIFGGLIAPACSCGSDSGFVRRRRGRSAVSLAGCRGEQPNGEREGEVLLLWRFWIPLVRRMRRNRNYRRAGVPKL